MKKPKTHTELLNNSNDILTVLNKFPDDYLLNSSLNLSFLIPPDFFQ